MADHQTRKAPMKQFPVGEPRVAIYARVADPTSDGLTQQEGRLRSYAADRGWHVSNVLAETRGQGVSDEMLDALSCYDRVLVQDLSRLSRSTQRLIGILRHVEDRGVGVSAANAVGAGPNSLSARMPGAPRAVGDVESVAAGCAVLNMLLATAAGRPTKGGQR